MTPLKFASLLVLVVILSIRQCKWPTTGPVSKTVRVPLSTCRPFRLTVKPSSPRGYCCHHPDGSNYTFVNGHVKWLNTTPSGTKWVDIGPPGGGFTFGT